VRRMMAELFGRVDGYCKGKGGSMHIADFAVGMLGANGIVGGGLPIACGAALAGQLEGKGAVTVCFFGDGAAAEGEFHESLNIASVWKLPIVFVCENNQYAANNPIGVQHPRVDIAAHAAPYDMPGVVMDGNDVLAVHAATGDAVTRARRGEGPSLLECKTYRWHFHAMRAARPPETRPERRGDWGSYRGPHVDRKMAMREISFQKALDEAVAEEMRRDARVITLGTDFTGDPIKEFGPGRVRFTPISEAVLTGMGLGAA